MFLLNYFTDFWFEAAKLRKNLVRQNEFPTLLIRNFAAKLKSV